MVTIPGLFCWSKMGVEAGQSLEAILRRKELERQAGNGSFAWGIGTSIPALHQAAETSGEPLPVLFSPMSAKPKAIDEHPESIVVWLGYLSGGCPTPLPGHMLLTSRGRSKHYVLFCRSDRSILESTTMELPVDRIRNHPSGARLGASQVTSLVSYGEHLPALGGRSYPIAFSAILDGPLHAQLALGVEMPSVLSQKITEAAADASVDEWARFVASVRGEAAKHLPEHASSPSLGIC